MTNAERREDRRENQVAGEPWRPAARNCLEEHTLSWGRNGIRPNALDVVLHRTRLTLLFCFRWLTGLKLDTRKRRLCPLYIPG